MLSQSRGVREGGKEGIINVFEHFKNCQTLCGYQRAVPKWVINVTEDIICVQ